jgi:hypothetical protein
MNFELEKSIELLLRTPKTYHALLANIKHDWEIINEGENTWSAFDIVGHLIHGEKTDWIPRAKMMLDDTMEDKTFEPFDRFAQQEISKGKTLEELLDHFQELRMKNIQELQSWNLSTADLEKKGIHPDLGEVTLKELIATWDI